MTTDPDERTTLHVPGPVASAGQREESAASAEPLPCPFCGGAASQEYVRESLRIDRSQPASVGCSNYDCTVNPRVYGQTKTEALQRWNTRAKVRDE